MTKDVSFFQMQRSLQRECNKARSTLTSVLENKYENLKQFGEYITSKPDSLKYTTTDGIDRKIEARVLCSSSKSDHVLLYDSELLRKFTPDEIFVDGTFDARPKIKKCNQLLTVLGIKYNVVSLKYVKTIKNVLINLFIM